MIVDCRDDIAVTSSAAGLPCVQEGRNTSAGRSWLLLLRFFFFQAKGSNLQRHKKQSTIIAFATRSINKKQSTIIAFAMIVDCRDDITVTSSAAGLPCVQEGRNTSAGRSWLLLLRFFFSREGLKFPKTRRKLFILSL